MNLLVINLCLTIALAYILFVGGVERTENEVIRASIHNMSAKRMNLKFTHFIDD
jgi:hypothetical protein